MRTAVLGRPISHSLSPALHAAAHAELGLRDWTYEAIECDEAGFGPWFARLGPDWAGVSLTMPLKRVAIPLLDELTPLVHTVGVMNTVVWSGPAQARRTTGHNTDVQGVVAALGSVGLAQAASACVLGAGATACSVLAALAELGCAEVLLLARSPERAAEAVATAGRLGIRASVGGLDRLRDALAAEVLVTTLPAAPAAAWAATLSEPQPDARPAGVLLDVTYHPWPTPAAAAWTAAGGLAVGGFEMLLHQAVAQVELMTGRTAPVAAMRAAGERALAAH
jgi:shikimate dehydrogenase